MGYAMCWSRLVKRNHLTGEYETADNAWGGKEAKAIRRNIASDMRRVENDQRDNRHLAAYSVQTGLTPEQVKSVLDLFFSDGGVWRTPNGVDVKDYMRRIDEIRNRLDGDTMTNDVTL